MCAARQRTAPPTRTGAGSLHALASRCIERLERERRLPTSTALSNISVMIHLATKINPNRGPTASGRRRD